jgi:hypothetical protein
MLLELWPHQRERERRAIDRSIDERPHVRHGANMILVPMREQQRGRSLWKLLEICQVGNEEIDARQLRPGEHDAGVDHKRCVRRRDGHEIHAELTEAAKRHDIQLGH